MTRRLLAALAGLALVAAAVPARGDVQYLRCESGLFGRYKECAAKTDGRVELVRDLSGNRCVQWKTWGYDRNGVWVDRGCRAEFRVGREGIGGRGAAVIGAVAGAAILGSILANKSIEPSTKAVAAPDWVRGRFHGFSPKLDTEFDITIDRDGTVTGTADGKTVTGHVMTNDGLQLGELEFKVMRESWGFSAKQKDDAEDVIYFRRK